MAPAQGREQPGRARDVAEGSELDEEDLPRWHRRIIYKCFNEDLMGRYAAEAVGLGKFFWTGARAERTLFGRLRASMTGEGGMARRWALREASFALPPGEALAVIGPNGAGKSTLLLLLAGVLTPSEGRAATRGRVGSFLSPGAGLYPELSVRENMRLTAALYGMSARELSARRDAITAFGELEPYLDSRLGELSAGYQARVVFATALHADFDLLIFDEVFSVGDAAFAARCLDRLRSARAAGAAAVLATHGLDTAERECGRRCAQRGRVEAHGACADVAGAYRRQLARG